MRISDWSSDVCSSDLEVVRASLECDPVQPVPIFGRGCRHIVDDAACRADTLDCVGPVDDFDALNERAVYREAAALAVPPRRRLRHAVYTEGWLPPPQRPSGAYHVLAPRYHAARGTACRERGG